MFRHCLSSRKICIQIIGLASVERANEILQPWMAHIGYATDTGKSYTLQKEFLDQYLGLFRDYFLLCISNELPTVVFATIILFSIVDMNKLVVGFFLRPFHNSSIRSILPQALN
jgi:hypothetical protein